MAVSRGRSGLSLRVEVHVPELDRRVIDVPCPRCELETPVQLGEIRRGDIIICRGCHSNVRLEDELGGMHRARVRLRRILGRLGM
jgi:transposase-like protein